MARKLGTRRGEAGQTLAVAHDGLDEVEPIPETDEIELMKTLREQLAELAPAQRQRILNYLVSYFGG